MKLRLYMLVLVIVCLWSAEAQVRKDAVRQDEMVSFKNDITYGQALMSLSEMSKRFVNKPIIDPAPLDNAPIGVNIESKHWLEALQMILTPVGRAFREEADYFLVVTARSSEAAKPAAEAEKPGELVKEPIGIDSREVLITTIFFDMDVQKSQSFGIDWSFSFLKGRDSLAVDLIAPAARSALNVNYVRPYRFGDILSTLQFFSQTGIADVISSPRIIVRSSEQGRVQIGTDISVTERTITPAGVTTSVRQIPTGIIVTVTPQVMKEGKIDFVYLDLEISQSNAITSGDAPTISKNSTKTHLLLVDGEEVFLSGLYTNRESVTRTGIPFLKDLPWWVFGLRYIFGSDERTSSRRDFAILLKAEIVPTLRERAAQKVRESAMEVERRKFEQDLERLKTKKYNEKQ